MSAHSTPTPRTDRSPRRPHAPRTWAPARPAPVAVLLVALLATLLPGLAVPPAVDAQETWPAPLPCTIAWDGGAGTDDWHHTANWTPERLPGPADVVCIDAAVAGNEVHLRANLLTQVQAVQTDNWLVLEAGTLALSGPSYTMATRVDGGALNVVSGLRTLEMDHNGGIVGGNGLVQVTGWYRWVGGAQWGPGRTEVLRDTGADFGGLLVEGPGQRVALSRTIDADAGMALEGGEVSLQGGSVLSLGAPSYVANGSGRVTGNGTLVVASELVVHGTSLDVESRFETGPDATVDVEQPDSVLALYGGGTQHGTFVLEDQTQLDLRGGAFTFSPESWVDVTGTGEVQVAHDATDATVLGTYNAATTTVMAGTIRLPEGTEVDQVELTGGTLAVDGAVTVGQVLHEDGTITGAGDLTVTGEYRWGKGTQAGAGSTTVQGVLGLYGPDVARTIDDRGVHAEVLDWVEPGRLDMTGEAGLSATSWVVDGVRAEVVGEPTALLQPGDLTASNDAVVEIGARVLTQPDEEILLEGTNTFLELSGGGDLHGRLTADGAVGVNVGGDMVFHPDSQVALGTGGLGIYEGGEVTLGSTAGLTAAEIGNEGTLHVDALVNVGDVINHGTLDVRGTGLLWASDYVQNLEDDAITTVEVDATLSTVEGGTVTVETGVLTGSGTVDADVVNLSGVVEPVGTLEVTRNYQQASDASLGVQTDGNASDLLQVAGVANLAGALSAVAETDAPATQPLEVLQASLVNGEFELFFGMDACWDVEHQANAVLVLPQPCVQVGQGSGVEDLGAVAFPVTLSAPYDADVTLTYSAQDGTAIVGQDLPAATGSVTIPAGQVSGEIVVPVTPDDVDEADETFGLAVTAAGAGLGTPTVQGTIVDDDEPADEEEPASPMYQVEVPATRGLWSYPSGLSSKYLIGYSNFDNLGTEFAFYYNLETGSVGYWGDIVYAWGINDSNMLVGGCGEPLWYVGCVRVDKVNHDLPTLAGYSPVAGAINDAGMMAGQLGYATGPNEYSSVAAVWSSWNSAPTIIDAGGESSYASAINDLGVVAGFRRTGFDSESWVWSAASGFVTIPMLPGASSMEPEAISASGTVVGSAWTSGTPGVRAWKWSPRGGLVDLGAGAARDINDEDDIVGWLDGRPTLWRNGQVYDLDEGLAEGQTGLSLPYYINDDGVIAATDLNGAVVVLHPVGQPTACELCLTVETEEQRYPTGEWIPTGGQVIDGNTVRVTATVENADDRERTVAVEVLDGETPLGEESSTLTLAPGESQDVQVEWDTTGKAWNGLEANETAYVDVRVLDAADGTVLEQLAVGTNVDPRPVVLVHGLWSDESTWASYPQFLAEAHPGWRAYPVDTMDTSSFVPNLVSENANLLDTYITDVQELENAWQVDLVGHSMGGLISRFYIQELMTNLGGKNAVANLVMLGTPNGGSPCAYLAAIPATYELRPDVVEAFNAQITDRRGVPMSVAVGIHVPVTCFAPYPGDDVVPVESAQTGFTDTQLFQIAHTSMTGSEALFSSWVLPHLRTQAPGLDGLQGATAAEPVDPADPLAPDAATAALVPEATPPAPEPTEDLAVDPELLEVAQAAPADPVEPTLVLSEQPVLEPGESLDLPVWVEDGALELGALAVAPGSVEVAVLDEGGAVLATTGTSADGMGFRSVALADPPSGFVTIRVHNAGASQVTVPLSAWVQGDVVPFQVTATQVGTTGAIQVTADFGGEPVVPWMAVQATVTDPDDGSADDVELYDDGQHGDGAAGDGTYGASLGGYGSGGYLVAAEATDGWFQRAATASVQLAVEGDGPGNDGPTALPLDLTTSRDAPVWFELGGTDPDGDDLGYEIVDHPDHGALGGTTPSIAYHPAKGYIGPDSFTYRVSDGLLWSAPVTVPIEVTKGDIELSYGGPWPTSFTQGSTVTVKADLIDVLGQDLHLVPVTFAFGDQVIETQAGWGTAQAELFLDEVPGQHTLTITFPGTDVYLPEQVTQTITVLPANGPQPTIIEPLVGEAGYDVALRVLPLDPDDDAVTLQVDWTDDGTWDHEETRAPGDPGAFVVAHAYADAHSGLVRVRVTDSTGMAGEATATSTIAPHRPLGATSIIEVDGVRVRGLDLSTDGRYLLYEVEDDEDGQQLPTPYGVLDRQTGTSELVSILPDGSPVQFPIGGVMSDNGRYVAFSRGEMVSGIWTLQTYLRDLVTDTTTHVSLTDDEVPANGGTEPVGVSDDGRYVAMSGIATNMTTQDTVDCGTGGQEVPCSEIYLRDVQAGTTTLVSANDDGTARHGDWDAEMTADGRWITFTSGYEVVLWDRDEGPDGDGDDLEVTQDGSVPGFNTHVDDITDDGRFVLFDSQSSKIVDGDTNGDIDLFRHDTQTGETVRVSVASDESEADGMSSFASMTCDASVVVFWSYATDLVPDDTNGHTDVFLRDVATGKTRRLSVEPRDGIQGNWDSNIFSRISHDGRWVVFESEAWNLVPGDINGERDVFLHDTGITRSCDGTPPPGNTAPTVSVADPGTLVEGGQVPLVATGADADGDLLTYTWSTDVGLVVGSGASVSLAADDGPGEAEVTVTVSDGEATGTATVVVPITNAAPTAAAGADVVVPWGVETTLTGAGTDPGPDDQGAGLTGSWDPGDGSPTVAGLELTHAWADPGTYPATLTVTDKDGATGTDGVAVTVTKHPNDLAVVAVPTSGGATVTATVTDPVAGGAGVAGRTVAVSVDGGAPQQVVTGTDGSAQLPVEGLAPGPHEVVATVAEDGHHLGDQAGTDVVVGSTVPGPPLDVSAIGGDASATVRWEPPLSDGGSPITGYDVEVTPGGTTVAVGVVLTTPVTGLANDVEHTFRVRARNANGPGPWSATSNVAKPRASCDIDAFTDVDKDHPFCPEIKWMADEGIARGYADGTFRPTADVTRQAMIAFAYRLAGFERGQDPVCWARPFPDVKIANPFCGAIDWAADEGITTGYEDGTFRPGAKVSRQAMAAFLYRLAGSPRGADPTCTTDEFVDVPAGHRFCGEIDWMVDSGLAGGYSDGTFRPTAPISRQAMAAFLFRFEILRSSQS